MESLTVIKSRQNPRYKALAKTLYGKLPAGLIVLEGKRLVLDALNSGLSPELIVIAEDSQDEALLATLKAMEADMIVVSTDLFKRLSDTVTPQGILLIGRFDEQDVDALVESGGERILVLAGLSDPGNVGALIRSAEAFGFSHVVYTVDGVSPLSRKAVRASMGSILRERVYRVDNMAAALEALAALNAVIYGLDMAGRALHEVEVDSRPLALIVGNEAHGLAQTIDDHLLTRISIPMRGHVESLNAAIAGAIAMYELGGKTCK